ncbi:MAG: sigma 54-interacting transcriptional regulator [Nitrospirota bacterium]
MTKSIKAGRPSFRSRLQFEELISNLSARFIRLPPDEVDREIESALHRLLDFFKADRCGLLQVGQNEKFVYVSHVAYAEGIRQVPSKLNLAGLFPWSYELNVERGESVIIRSLSDLPPEARLDRQSFSEMGVRSSLAIPLQVVSGTRHIIALQSLREEQAWPEQYVPRLLTLGDIFVSALERKQAEEKLREAYAEIKQLKDRLEAENIYLWQEIEMAQGFDDIVGRSDALKYVLYRVGQFAPTDTTILITGETGTGKGLIARAIHSLSKRKNKPMIHVNCAALPANLIESELFGREKGAFTGAQEKQIGRFELAHQGTIFLDEVGELPLELQPKLLRVLEDGAFERLGSPHTIKVNMRVIASTNRNLDEDVMNGRFRKDLYYRLNVLPITVPPLRQRRDDIPLLVEYFVKKLNKKYGKHISSVPQDVINSLQSYLWPGNVRELENVIERAVITSCDSSLKIREKIEATLPFHQEAASRSLEVTERAHILKVLQETGWKIEGPKGAALILGINPSTLRTRMKKLGIHRPTPS